MGATARLNILSILWISCTIFVFYAFLICIHGPLVSSAELDSDLVFDNSDSPKLLSQNNKHSVVKRNSESSADSSHKLKKNEGWFSSALTRVKRQLLPWFETTTAPSEDDTSPDQQEQNYEDETDNLNEILDQSTDDGDLIGEFDGRKNHSNHPSKDPILSDDEDLDVISGDAGSAEVPTHPVVTEHVPSFDDKPVYYRITFTAFEPYRDEFRDHSGNLFVSLSRDIIQAIDEIYRDFPGDQMVQGVVNVESRPSDSFSSKLTVDIASVGNHDHEAIKDHLYNYIQNYHKLGNYRVSVDDFTFRQFEARPPLPIVCLVNELSCRDGNQCVPSTSRCNGFRDCSDGSDEEGCPPQTQAPYHPPETTPRTPESTSTGVKESDDNGNKTYFTYDNTSKPPNKCRADDVVKCADGSQYICADQECDGHPDCPNGEDEKNCPSDCAEGELSCDLGRCIPASKTCDGIEDCADKTDEIFCPSQCRSDEFRCNDGTCIDRRRLCDTRPDCVQGEDERNCPQPQRCHPTEDFTCGDGRCVSISTKCDRKYDCEDHSDERNCPCRDDDFKCANGFCIPLSQKCDGTTNCNDGSDEQECISAGPCQYYEWQCADASKCIDQSLRCNKQVDCTDNSDELDCAWCSPDEFRCDNGTCLNIARRCDGANDCPNAEDEKLCAECTDNQFKCERYGGCIDLRDRCNGRRDCQDNSDEENCNGKKELVCVPDHWMCRDKHNCINIDKVCDGKVDCEDKSDEFAGCNSSYPAYAPATETITKAESCDSNQFRCNDGTCISQQYRCDTLDDCPDKSDEIDCDAPEKCESTEVKCSDGSCVFGKTCDSVFDCADGSDEENCTLCAPSQFRCRDGTCIDENKRCDSRTDCLDRSDEEDCVFHCPGDSFRCSNGLCLDAERRCDGYSDCDNGEDEKGCPIHGSPTFSSQNKTACQPGEFQCQNGRCIQDIYRCDKFDDCEDGSDEDGCASTCKPEEFDCEDGSCVPESRKCDGRRDCPSGADELDCPGPPPPRSCSPSEHTCLDGSCIPRYLVCDGTPHCRDNSDESDCGCSTEEFQCEDGTCIYGYLRCNGIRDCSDDSDEFNCPTEAPVPTPPYRPPQPPPSRPFSCPIGQQACNSGNQCFPYASFCDGRFDCNDFSDETNCPGSSDGLNLKTYPSQQSIKESNEVVFQCRDEGPLRARVKWSRGNGLPLPPGTRDLNGRLEIPDIKVEHAGSYICSAIGYPSSTPGSQVYVNLQVEKYIIPTVRPPQACGLHEATCSNGDCISKHLVCDGKYDCADGSDETRCNPFGCEPNEFRCRNKRCVLKTWMCDGDDDCGDGTDEVNCATNPPGSQCRFSEFACHSGNQCIPKSFHCDHERDCIDGSDEIGCSSVVISKPPPPMITLSVGELFSIECTAVAIPTPEIVWRLNWGHIPEKCTTVSNGGVGVLTCPDIQISDQGAYSCEAINIRGTVFAVPDTILVVNPGAPVCPRGYFNNEAVTESQCIPCFCFGATTECRSADLFTYQLQPPFDTHRYVGVGVDPYSKVIDIRNEPIYRGNEPRLTPVGRNGVQASLPYAQLSQNNVLPYFVLPESFHGNQLKSYGGYIKFNVRYEGYGEPTYTHPNVILVGNGYTLLHFSEFTNRQYQNVSVRIFAGEGWVKRTETAPETQATREEIMMALENVENILIKLQYIQSDNLETTLTDIEMDSAAVLDAGQGAALFVEECKCPVGYSGLSCENCAPGYTRHRSGPWLGQCYKEVEKCPLGTYGDPSRGIPCEICPCPLTNPSNQFARTCSLDSDGDVTCDCPPEYVGRRCQQCAPGYTGNPLIPGDSCKQITSVCHPEGSQSLTTDERGLCQCKQNTYGPTCSQCKSNTFHLSQENQFGCIACFCMGVTQECSSSNWYRSSVSTAFTSSRNDFKLLASLNKSALITDGINIEPSKGEIVFSNFRSADVYYWVLPPRYLGDKVSSYGGNLRYSIRYIPTPGGYSKNNAPDVELISENQLNLLYYGRDSPQGSGVHNFTVPLLEQNWQRSDGQVADREHLLMTLADLKAILIKATYTTNSYESALSSVSLDIAEDRNTGRERALSVEQCICPQGYRGLSCEDCDIGWTRATEGLYLGLCEPCSCNGHSAECDPESGECWNCRDHTTGSNCESCLPGYTLDSATGTCRYLGSGDLTKCEYCNEDGIAVPCTNNVCQCKSNVEGDRCDRCRPGTFGFNTSRSYGCQECFCSGLTSECSESNMYIEQLPSQIFDENHGFVLTDENQRDRITSDFEVDIASNRLSYNFRSRDNRRWYWALPSAFTGNQIRSYGGRLEFTLSFSEAFGSRYVADKDVIIYGNGVSIFWTNPRELYPDVDNPMSVVISADENWQRLDYRQGPRPATRQDILTVLSNIEAILIRATLSSETSFAHISDVALDTAVDNPTGQPRANNVEVCRCPSGYRGTSCESCSAGYYRDNRPSPRDGQVYGSCVVCPCHRNEESCDLAPSGDVVCHCRPGFHGRYCEIAGQDGLMLEMMPANVEAPLETEVKLTCKYKHRQRLQIELMDSGSPIYNVTDFVEDGPNDEYGGYKVFYIKMNGPFIVVTCVVKNMDNFVVGMITSRLHAGPAPYPPVPEPPVDRPPAPQIYIKVDTPVIHIKEIGSTVQLRCEARSLTTPSKPVIIRWSKDGGELPYDRFIDDRRGLLVITSVRVSDSGRYICEASDGVEVVTDYVTLHVGDGGESVAPRVTIYPENLEVTEGEEITLRCTSTGVPVPNLTWIKKSGDPISRLGTITSGVLRIPSALKGDEADYECIATNEKGSDRFVARVVVRARPVFTMRPRITPDSYSGKSGDKFTLTCETHEPYRSIDWSRKDGVSLPYSSSIDNSVLTVYDAKPEDSGTYVCTVTSYSGTRGNESAVVSISSGVQGEYPTVRIEPERQTVFQGTNAEIFCNVSGFPPPTVKWTKVGEVLSSNAIQIGPVLRISNVQVSDRGVYVCVASNDIGLAQASSIVEVDRREPPVIQIHPSQSQTVTVGGSALIHCRVMSGIPHPTVVWSRPTGLPLGPTIEQLSNGVLRFNSITVEDNGEYLCTAENVAGKVTAIANIEVQTVPSITLRPSGNIRVRENEYVRLECQAEGFPLPTVQWSKYLRVQQLASRTDASAGTQTLTRELPSSAIYEINRVTAADEGSYSCQGRNSAGVTEERVYLIVDSLPSRGDITGEDPGSDRSPQTGPPYEPDYRSGPENPSHLTFTAPVGTRAELRCQTSKLGNENVYLNWIRSDNTSLPPYARMEQSGGLLVIDNVQKADAGEYRCLGIHNNNVIFSLVTRLNVTEPPRITLLPQRQIVRPGDNVFIECVAAGEQPISISWSALNRSMPSSVYVHEGHLQFRGIQNSDAGRYRCTATNIAGKADSVAEVIVEERVKGPMITADNREQSATIGSSITLHCQVQSPERPTVRWFRENNHLPESVQTSGEYLRINNIQPGDEGRYICEISNDNGVSSDFINLQVTGTDKECGDDEWRCSNGICIPQESKCDGKFDCSDNSDEYYCYERKRRDPNSESEPNQELFITPSSPVSRLGYNLDLNCYSTNPETQVLSWSKTSGPLIDNVQTSGGYLRIDRLRTDNVGIYRCTAKNRQQMIYKDYVVDIVDSSTDNVQSEEPIETKSAPQGSTVVMNCRTDLPSPVSFKWSKSKGMIPENVDVNGRTLQLTDVQDVDAGIYVCTAENGDQSVDIPTILIVTGIVPFFPQTPSSYIALSTLPDHYLQFSFEISFKPETPDGLILFNSNKRTPHKFDFISLALVDGIPEFKFSLGQGITVVKGDKPLSLGKWHTIKVTRNRKKAVMHVDNKEIFVGHAEGKAMGLDLTEHLYLGGVPEISEISDVVGVEEGFVGCIGLFKIGHAHQDILKEAILKESITTCETCTDTPCKNQGVCQEALNSEGYTCICPSGYGGRTCNKDEKESCTPSSCGSGRCIDTEHGYDCLCPLGKAGRHCEQQIEVVEPAFQNDAYLAYPTPRLQRRLKVSLKFKPADLRDGILLYCSESEEGHGDFASLAIKDKHIEFRFDVGSGPVTVRSEKEIKVDEWLAVSASKILNEGRLIVNGDPAITTRIPGTHKALSLHSLLYVGGVDKHNIKVNDGVGVKSGFNGCISEISVSGLDLNIVKSATDAANVQDCSNINSETNPKNNDVSYSHENAPSVVKRSPCSSNPCVNKGDCHDISANDYFCTCRNGYRGRHCEVAPNLCEQYEPCQNGGTCNGTTIAYVCACPLGYTGTNCEERADIRQEVHFTGNGYLELSKSLLSHEYQEESDVIALELSTNSSNGLVFWHGQTPADRGEGEDFISLAVVDGYLEYSYDLGSGPVIIYNDLVKINDGERHKVILKREGQFGTIEIDNDFIKEGMTDGPSTTLECKGNIYIGGTPNITSMTGGRYFKGFEGCIHGFELQDSRLLDLGEKAMSGVNVKPCSRNDLDFLSPTYGRTSLLN